MVRLLIHSHADINVVDESGRTPLIIAAGKGYADIVKILLAGTGVNVDAGDDSGETALTAASKRKFSDIVNMLAAAKNRT